MEPRTLVTFRSHKFNTSETKPHYINPHSFGDDVAEWLQQQLKERAISVDERIGQEDFGWYLGFSYGPQKYHFVLSHHPHGYWLGWLERQKGFVASLFGARERGVQPDAAVAIHSVLCSSDVISDVLWHYPKDFDALRQNLGASTPLG